MVVKGYLASCHPMLSRNLFLYREEVLVKIAPYGLHQCIQFLIVQPVEYFVVCHDEFAFVLVGLTGEGGNLGLLQAGTMQAALMSVHPSSKTSAKAFRLEPEFIS